jgi:hypothetical protein
MFVWFRICLLNEAIKVALAPQGVVPYFRVLYHIYFSIQMKSKSFKKTKSKEKKCKIAECKEKENLLF